MWMRANLARWSVLIVPAALTLNACSDSPTAVSSSSQNIAAAPRSIENLSGLHLTGKTIVIFKDSTSIPSAGLALISSLGGTVTKIWDDVGVPFVGGLPIANIATLSASNLVAAVGNDRYVNWLPRLKVKAI